MIEEESGWFLMRMSLQTRLTLITIHGAAMLLIGMGLFYIHSTMTNVVFNVFGSIFALLLIAAALLYSAVLDWVFAASMVPRHVRELWLYLILSVISAAGGLFFLFYPNASIRMACYFIAAYALFLGIGKLRLAMQQSLSRLEKVVLSVFGAIAVCFSGILAAIANQGDGDAIVVLAVYSLYGGIQMLLAALVLYRRRIATTNAIAGSGRAIRRAAARV